MSLVTVAPSGKANGFRVVEGVVVLPRAGAWHAEELVVDSPDALEGAVEIRVGDSGTLKGTVTRADVYRGMLRARVVAGGAGLRKNAMPRHFHTPTVGVVLADLAKGVGEAVSPTASTAVTGVQLPRWTTAEIPAGDMLNLLLERAPAGTVWRLLADGTIWAGAETWPDSRLVDAVEVSRIPEDAVAEIGLASPWVLPGTTVGGRKVDLVEMKISGGAVRTTIWVVP